MTWTGRDPQLTEPMPVTNGYRQGSISGAQVRGLERAPRRGPWRGLVFLIVLVAVIVVGGGVFGAQRLRDFAFDFAASNPQVMRMPLLNQAQAGGQLEIR